jgi:hypothetical protein
MTTTFLVRGSSWSRVGDAAVVPAQVVRLFPGVRAEWYDERAAEYRLRSIRDGVAVAVTVERAARRQQTRYPRFAPSGAARSVK